MFKNWRIASFIIFPLLAAFTLVMAMNVDFYDPIQKESFWYVISGIVLSEIMLMLSSADIGGNHSDKGLLYRVGNNIISIFYFCFTLGMLLPFYLEMRCVWILIFEFVGLFAALSLQLGYAVVTHSTAEKASNQQRRLSDRKQFYTSLACMRPLLIEKTSDDSLIHKFNQLIESAKFSSESLPGSEKINEEISNEIDSLKRYLEHADIEKFKEVLNCLIYSFQKREIQIKTLRK